MFIIKNLTIHDLKKTDFFLLIAILSCLFVVTGVEAKVNKRDSKQNAKQNETNVLTIQPPKNIDPSSIDNRGSVFSSFSLQYMEAQPISRNSKMDASTAEPESTMMLSSNPMESGGGSAQASTCMMTDTYVNVYTDYVVGAWGNWSWANNNPSSTTFVKDHDHAMQIDFGPWKAVWFQNEKLWVTFDNFNHIEFWVNGGSNSNQTFQVVLSVDRGSWLKLPITNYVTVTANTWTQVRIPFADFGIADGSNITGIGLYNTSSNTIPSLWVDSIRLVNLVECYDSQISVDSSTTLTTFSSLSSGINTAVWDSHLSNVDTHDKLDDAGISFVRFPGGSISDQYDWTLSTNKVDGANYTIDSNDLVDLSNYLGAEALVNINYGSGTYTEAYNWLYDLTVTQSANIRYWGVGNENYGSWETDWKTYKHDAYTYAYFMKDFYNLAKGLNSHLQIGVNGTEKGSDYSQRFTVTNPSTGTNENGWSAVLLHTLNNLGITPDFYEIHIYPQGPNREDDSYLLYSTDDLMNIVSSTRQVLNDYLGSASQVPIFVTELNSVSSKPGKQSRSFVNAMYLADAYVRLTQEDVACLWWDVHNSEETGNNNSVTLSGNENYGDYGILATGYGSEPLNTPYPTFHALELLRTFARPGDNLIETTTNDLALSVFASSDNDTGDVRMLVINRSADRDITATLTPTGFNSPSTVTVHSYGEIEYQQNNGVVTTSESVNPSLIQLTFPKYSISVVEF